MKVIKSETITSFDVDDTLVMRDGKGTLKIPDPYAEGEFISVRPHTRHIKLLKDLKARGEFIVVWSGGGFAWGEAVVKALNLESHVDLVMTKVHKYIDDLPAHEVLGIRVYLNEKGNIQDEQKNH